ncbi:ester cyclase [Brevundimonas sp.]|jgi:predicted ester cyclase|uniref:ester cyclase n=1 Tax=Brevundimonas sp. TaxID=1871086 RepID=UPI001D7597B0|nr:ester cyclase [Caulobacteraceae bacterium]HEV7229595.1 ester cyclase [Brevundimonas sp.]
MLKVLLSGAVLAVTLYASQATAQSLTPPAPEGTVAYNEWLGRTFSEVLLNERSQDRRIEILNVIVAEDYIQHNPLVPEGRQGLIDFIPVIYQAMPDARFTLHDVFATEDRVVTRWTWTGTLTGEGFLGIAPRGQKVEFDVIDVWSVRDGQLYEHWDQFDWPRAFVQLGVQGLPQPFVDVAARPYDR